MLATNSVSILEIISIIVCIILSGFFSGAEAVLLSIDIDRAKQLIEEKDKKSGVMKFLIENPNDILATILVGNNIVNILAASITTAIAGRIFENKAIAISTGITTVLILIFGEIIPKTFARNQAENLSVFVLKTLKLSYFLLYPIVKSLVWMIKKVLGDKADLSERLVTKNDIEYFINKAEKEKTMDSKQLDLIASVLEFPTIKVKDIMIPRLDVKYLSLTQTSAEIIKLITEDRHSRYPVCNSDLDDIFGFLHVKDLVFANDYDYNDKVIHLETLVKKPFFIYEHMKIHAVFDYMKRKKVHLALVKDENGLVVGIVTLEDIIEEIMGEIEDEHDISHNQSSVVETRDLIEGIYVEGTISLRDLYSEYDLKIPLNDNYSTLAGFILDMLGNSFPKKGQLIIWEGYSFELKTIENQEIKILKIKDVDGEKHLFSKKEVSDIQNN